ncbi:protein ZBED8 [Trichonephila clavipes]|nr:protein ZBED8 [Trichonephila clavipes]
MSYKKRSGRNFRKGNLNDKSKEITHIAHDTQLELLASREKKENGKGPCNTGLNGEETEPYDGLDEATDSNKDAHFIAYVRFWDGMSAVEELLFCKPIKLKATAIALFDILNSFINEANIEWKIVNGICTDGARTMSGSFKSIQALVKQKSPHCIWTHCMIHREALVSKEISPGLNIVLMTVVAVVNYIKMRPLKSRIFSDFAKTWA